MFVDEIKEPLEHTEGVAGGFDALPLTIHESRRFALGQIAMPAEFSGNFRDAEMIRNERRRER